jgi:hypothetical protein
MLAGGEIILGHKGLASVQLEPTVAELDATLLRPERRDENPRFQKLLLEDHGAHIPAGVWARTCQRILALAAGVWHSSTL